MRGRAAFRIERRDGVDRLVDVRCEPPIAIRRCGTRVVLVGTAAAPLGGDRTEVDVVVGRAARADVGSVAASLALPGPTPHDDWPAHEGPDRAGATRRRRSGGSPRSSTRTNLCVEPEAHLRWWPEPLVSVVGSSHRTDTTVELSSDASCLVVEELALGRSHETSGIVDVVLRVIRDGRALVHHAERFGPDEPGAGSVARDGGVRHVVSAITVGEPSGAPATVVDASGSAAWLPVAADVAMVLAVGVDRPAALAAVRRVTSTSDRFVKV